MKLMLLVSLKIQTPGEQEWRLDQEIEGAVRRNDLKPLQTDGVILVGRDALLFDQSIAHSSFVRACAHLLAVRPSWPYLVVPVDPSAILAEGTCGDKLQAILDRSKVQDGINAPMVS